MLWVTFKLSFKNSCLLILRTERDNNRETWCLCRDAKGSDLCTTWYHPPTPPPPSHDSFLLPHLISFSHLNEASNETLKLLRPEAWNDPQHHLHRIWPETWTTYGHLDQILLRSAYKASEGIFWSKPKSMQTELKNLIFPVDHNAAQFTHWPPPVIHSMKTVKKGAYKCNLFYSTGFSAFLE